MKLKNEKKLLDKLTKESANPKEFIYKVMALQGLSTKDLAQKSNITTTHFRVMMSHLLLGKESIGIKTCVKIAKGLDIDPFLLNRIITDYSMGKYLKSLKSENSKNFRRT